MTRIGLYGGTFDPVHIGHTQLAEAAICEAGLDRVLMVPAVVPPHKSERTVTPFDHRVEMVRLALVDHPGIELSLIESELPTPSYTIDTVRLLQRLLPTTTELHFIIGIDAFVEITSWKSYGELLSRVSLLVAMRQGLCPQLLEKVRDELSYSKVAKRWVHSGGRKDIFFLSSPIADISSSTIRKQLLSGAFQVEGIPNQVMQYIQANNLYLSCK
ncbi:nicotinate (nicotinamide) nucleotide adenylyltransferase [Desulfopila sp. IMCC35008]|uniref:nicotinate (nicotinamide) nucleotide adenylyltransferase n=1 Tax=Desulfopila sp. IMCC35008 TaxID=2653858 RepID=UPI001F10D8C1|nr:nicotinate (nicotinamide) nucleotide adenylyltransferase [Desulfopila sp. IMCC35008]